jgi:hypothetical protein
MFGKNKPIENRYVIAIKNYIDTVKSIKDGSMPLPYNRDIYIKLIDGGGNRATIIKELSRFIKINGKIKKEVYHFWESLIMQGYTFSMSNM